MTNFVLHVSESSVFKQLSIDLSKLLSNTYLRYDIYDVCNFNLCYIDTFEKYYNTFYFFFFNKFKSAASMVIGRTLNYTLLYNIIHFI